MSEDFIDGYVEKDQDGTYGGKIKIDGVDLSPICASLFKENGVPYLWLRRKPIMDYDAASSSYKTRAREPQWESYLKKDGVSGMYKGVFVFLRFKYSITGIWDSSFGMDSQQRLNLFVERLPISEQTILQSINQRKRTT